MATGWPQDLDLFCGHEVLEFLRLRVYRKSGHNGHKNSPIPAPLYYKVKFVGKSN